MVRGGCGGGGVRGRAGAHGAAPGRLRRGGGGAGGQRQDLRRVAMNPPFRQGGWGGKGRLQPAAAAAALCRRRCETGSAGRGPVSVGWRGAQRPRN